MLCRSVHRIAGKLVWRQTKKNLQGEGCHEELCFGGSRGTSSLREACLLRRRVVGWGRRRIGICGTLDLSRHMDRLPTFEGVWHRNGGCEGRLLSTLCRW